MVKNKKLLYKVLANVQRQTGSLPKLLMVYIVCDLERVNRGEMCEESTNLIQNVSEVIYCNCHPLFMVMIVLGRRSYYISKASYVVMNASVKGDEGCRHTSGL